MLGKKHARYSIWLSPQEMDTLLHNKELQLRGEQHHYLTRVIRVKKNTAIDCIAQSGYIATASIIDSTRESITICYQEHLQCNPPGHHIILALGASKALRRSFILEKIVELTIQELWVWNADYSQQQPIIKDSWYTVLHNAATQCKNPFIPSLTSFPSLDAMLEASKQQPMNRLFFHEKTAEATPSTIYEWNAKQQPLLLIVGCEGGFSPREVSLLQSYNIPARTLGSSTLRYETAGLVACSLALMMNDPYGIIH